MSYMDYDEELVGEAPCEFCDELYPLCLLIEHQTTHLNEFDYLGEANIPPAVVSPVIHPVTVNPEVNIEMDKYVTGMKRKRNEADVASTSKHKPKKVEVEKQQSPVKKIKEDEEKQQMLSPVKSAVIKDAIPTQPPNTLNSTVDTKKNQLKNYHSEIEEFTTEKGEKLLVYGADIEPVENLESEKLESCKTPNNPLLNTKEDVIDISSLSDDDGDETLEEFWKRARDFLKTKRGSCN